MYAKYFILVLFSIWFSESYVVGTRCYICNAEDVGVCGNVGKENCPGSCLWFRYNFNSETKTLKGCKLFDNQCLVIELLYNKTFPGMKDFQCKSCDVDLCNNTSTISSAFALIAAALLYFFKLIILIYFSSYR